MLPDVVYYPPDFSAPRLAAAPNVTLAPAPANGVLPQNPWNPYDPHRFYSTTNYPTYIKYRGEWRLVARPRMDAVIVQDPQIGGFVCLEMRSVQKDQLVVLGTAEDGSTGILVHAQGFPASSAAADTFSFMTGVVSRERPLRYENVAQLIKEQRDSAGYSIWVLGPAVVHSGHSGAREAMSWLIEHKYVSVIFGGNAVATHDLECAVFGTTLGMDHDGQPVPGGHRHHMDAINLVRAAGSIRAAVEANLIKNGIMYSATRANVPFVLAGSIRDDGPLPEVLSDTLIAQNAMRGHTQRATLVVMLATMLHSIATGNMVPTFVERNGTISPVYTIAVDQSEHVISKLIDRGTHQAIGIVRNADDFLVRLTLALKELE